jgi:hypothetical protein
VKIWLWNIVIVRLFKQTISYSAYCCCNSLLCCLPTDFFLWGRGYIFLKKACVDLFVVFFLGGGGYANALYYTFLSVFIFPSFLGGWLGVNHGHLQGPGSGQGTPPWKTRRRLKCIQAKMTLKLDSFGVQGSCYSSSIIPEKSSGGSVFSNTRYL